MSHWTNICSDIPPPALSQWCPSLKGNGEYTCLPQPVRNFGDQNDRDGFPKYFQTGTIADNPADFYHSRIPKKQRKRTIVEELLADSEFRRYNRRKYSEIMAEKTANAAGKKFRKKKKFRN